MPLDPKQLMPYYKPATITPAGTAFIAYTALMNQAATAHPTQIILSNNTAKTITWLRLDVGDYEGTISNPVDPDKTTILCNNGLIPQHQVHARIVDPTTIQITTAINGTPTDGLLTNITLEIKEYQ